MIHPDKGKKRHLKKGEKLCPLFPLTEDLEEKDCVQTEPRIREEETRAEPYPNT